jgi:hypothetical protein
MPADASGRAAVSRNWRFLKDLDLIDVERGGRLARVTLLREDGSGRKYVHPAESKESYLQLPFAYWFDGFHEELTLPGKAMLLIALSLRDGFTLPARRVPEWYGLSAATAERGLRDLRQADLLKVERKAREAPLAPDGWTWVNLYTLKKPFGPKGTKTPEDELSELLAALDG